MKRTIPQGQYVAPRFAAESFVGSRYSIDGEFSANPADYWHLPDSAVLGALVGPVTLRTVTGRLVTTSRVIKSAATMGDLRRIVRAVTGMVAA